MSKTHSLELGAFAVIGVGALAFLLWSRPSRPVEIGEAAPDFTLPALGGGSVSLRHDHAKVVVLNFWATWCPPCVEETPSLEKFAEQLRSSNVAVIGVSVDQDFPALEKFVARYRLSYPIARDSNRAVASRYGTFKFPETYILDADGRVAEKIVGPLNWQDSRILDFVRELAHPSPTAGL